MKLLNKFLFFLFLAVGTFHKAQEGPPSPPPGGGGGVGPGTPASPIDMYVYLLVLVAIIFILYYHRKLHKNII
jgi:hypothetical protein